MRLRPQIQTLSRRLTSERLNSQNSLPVVHVVAAAVIDPRSRVLIAQRVPGSHLAGGWEFPGGKVEQGEERVDGLARELREELGIAIRNPRPLMRIRHAYPSREILLDMWVVYEYSGKPQGLDGQALRWCTQEELTETELLPADKPIVAALRLPPRLTQMSTLSYTVGGASEGKLQGAFCSSIPEAIAATNAGADFLVITVDLLDEQLAALCDSVSQPVFARKFPLEAAWALGASGTNEIKT